MERIRHIVLITTGQPSLNPRLVKEADSLYDNGYKVTVIYQCISDWASNTDATLLAKKSWNSVCVGRIPRQNKFHYLLNTIIHKGSILLNKVFGFQNGLAENALARGVYSLTKAAISIDANLYIAHNLGALPAAVKAARIFDAKCGFDAEDFHRYEITNNELSFDVNLKKFIENKFIPKVNYLTASSQLIANEYEKIFKKSFTVILNSFPKTKLASPANFKEPLKFVWFSQTIDKGRGIELIIDALNEIDKPFELHLLGQGVDGFINECERKIQFKKGKLTFHKPILPDDIFDFCRDFDIGLCLEQKQPFNRNICLTNKVFTYLQTGLAIIASNTRAQKGFMNEYKGIGSIFKNKNELIKIINRYEDNRDLLNQHKINSFHLGQSKINWEIDQQKFLSVIQQTLVH